MSYNMSDSTPDQWRDLIRQKLSSPPPNPWPNNDKGYTKLIRTVAEAAEVSVGWAQAQALDLLNIQRIQIQGGGQDTGALEVSLQYLFPAGPLRDTPNFVATSTNLEDAISGYRVVYLPTVETRGSRTSRPIFALHEIAHAATATPQKNGGEREATCWETLVARVVWGAESEHNQYWLDSLQTYQQDAEHGFSGPPTVEEALEALPEEHLHPLALTLCRLNDWLAPYPPR